MVKSIASINSLLVGLKTVNNSLLIKLQQLGFNTNLRLGAEQEYTIKTLIQAIDTLSIQLLTITSNRKQFIQRTSYQERAKIESYLNHLLNCQLQTKQELIEFHPTDFNCNKTSALCYSTDTGEHKKLTLLDAVEFIERLKPYCRMLEMIIAQERIHALSAVLETLLSKPDNNQDLQTEKDQALTDEQSDALELSQYLMRQAL